MGPMQPQMLHPAQAPAPAPAAFGAAAAPPSPASFAPFASDPMAQMGMAYVGKQLQGGILNHFAQLPDAGLDWQGECFVFDRRVALDTRLQETATTAEQVFDPRHADEAWRLQRAQQLDRSLQR